MAQFAHLDGWTFLGAKLHTADFLSTFRLDTYTTRCDLLTVLNNTHSIRLSVLQLAAYSLSFRRGLLHCQKYNIMFHGYVQFTDISRPRIYKLFTMALGELQRSLTMYPRRSLINK